MDDYSICTVCMARVDIEESAWALHFLHPRCKVFQSIHLCTLILEFLISDGIYETCCCGGCLYEWLQRGWRCPGLLPARPEFRV